MADGRLDEEQSTRLYGTLGELVGGGRVLGERLRATTLPLDDPALAVELKKASKGVKIVSEGTLRENFDANTS